MENRSPLGFRLIKIASVYMLASLALGFYMGVIHDYALLSVHSHIGLLGWITMALVGLIYVAAPKCDGNTLSQLHFWLHNAGLPIMISGLIWNQKEPGGSAEAVIGVGTLLVTLSLLSFAVNLVVNYRKK